MNNDKPTKVLEFDCAVPTEMRGLVDELKVSAETWGFKLQSERETKTQGKMLLSFTKTVAIEHEPE